MTILQALILGAVQGLTEFLPISSSGHLVVLPLLVGWPAQPLVFDVILHLGTACALIVYFWRDLIKVAKAFALDFNSADGRLGLYILIGSIPAVIVGYFFEDFFELYFRGLLPVVVFLSFGTFLMIAAEVVNRIRLNIASQQVTVTKSFIVGLFQALALFPGVSRSGATISGGMILGLTREESARFSFLLAVPVVVGAAFFKILDSFNGEFLQLGGLQILLGFLSSFLVGMAAINFLLKFLKTNTLWVFVFYRVALVLLLISVQFLL